MPLLTVDSLTKRYRSTLALDAVAFQADGGVLGLVGPNGAGKTTLLRILATTLAPDGGSVDFDGLRPDDPLERIALRRRLGYVPQNPGSHPSFSAFAFVDYVAVLKEMTDRRTRHDEVRRVLTAVGLDDVMHRRMRKLSGGMRQRVALAQALLGDPDLLVLDEPTVGLDPDQRLRFRELVSELADDKLVVLSTHLTEDVEALCHRVVVLAEGRVRFDGAVPDVAAVAAGRVWRSAEAKVAGARSWRTGDGTYRHLGTPPPDADVVEPTVADGYLILVGDEAEAAAA